MTKKADMYMAERMKGKTYQEIANEFGVSYQAVAMCIGKHHPGHFRPLTQKQCVYPGLRRWMNENKVSQAELLRRMGMMVGGRNSEHLRSLLNGRTEFKKKNIDLLLKITGMTYEVLLYREEETL